MSKAWKVLVSPDQDNRYDVVTSDGCVVLSGAVSLRDAARAAAAPDLLEALESMEDEVRAYGELYEPGGGADKKWRKALIKAQLAIAKARGES